MSAIHVVVRPHPDRAPSPILAPLYGLFDVVVDGVNITARIGEGFALTLLADLGRAVSAFARGRRTRDILQLYTTDDVWELGLELDGDAVLVTVYRAGPSPEVAVFERRVTLAALREAVLQALQEAPDREDTPHGVLMTLRVARRELEEGAPACSRPSIHRRTVRLSSTSPGPLAFHATAPFRVGRAVTPAGDPQVERADLHSLLVRGELRLSVQDYDARMRSVHLFLLAERLLGLARDALDAWQAGRPLFRRVEMGTLRIGVRRRPGDGPLELGLDGVDGRGGPVAFPGLDARAFAGTAVSFARALVEAFTTTDPAQKANLRLHALASGADALADAVEEVTLDDSVTNPEPDSYRSFAPRRPAAANGRGIWERGGKMRFMPRWVAAVPDIDLRATFLCGDYLIVGAARETACLDRRTGHVRWRIVTRRGGSVVTPSGLARIEPDGAVSLHELDSGEVRFSARVRPRSAGGATGAVVHSPGLPKLLVLAEGDRQITAIDLVTGEVRWRHTARRPAAYRMRRAGRLLLLTGGDSALVALDVATGEVVWRIRGRLPFSAALSIDHDAAFALSGTSGSTWTLHHLDPWTGEIRFSSALDDRPAPGHAPLITPEVVVVPTRDQRGDGARAFDRNTGDFLWEQAPGLASKATAWLAIDDAVVANSDAGTLLCLDAATGTMRYSHVFSRNVEADQPRRLEPVVRSGALFVPQHRVHVVRPGDGELLGTVPADLIPDLLRVDEACNVYVAEDSGHLAAFEAAPRLTLVK